jgi:hypothetical protein
MDTFIATIFSIFDNINTVKQKEKTQQKQRNETKPQDKLINTHVEEKQYLAYYIYRIWIKYRTLMEYTNTVTEFNKVLTSLNMPVKYFKYRVSFPMQNKMVNNEKQIDMIILMILKQMNKCQVFFTSQLVPLATSSDIDMKTPQGQYKQITELLKTKDLKTIVNDINNIKILVPNLSKPSGRGEIWKNSTPYMMDE